MPLPEVNDFTKRVLKHIKFSYDHKPIKSELEEHIEDMMEDYILDGMNEKEAVLTAVMNMGDPDFIGEELNKVHSPVLGSLWITTKVLAVIAVIIMVFGIGAKVINVISSVNSEYHSRYEENQIVYKAVVKEKFKLDDMNLLIDEVIRYDNNVLEVRYTTWLDPFSKSIDWSFNMNSSFFYDEYGNNFYYGGGGSGGYPFERHQSYIEDFPEDSQMLIIDFDFHGRKVYCEVPLKESAVNEAD